MNGVIRETREIVREEPVMHARILRALATGGLTVPEIAAAIHCPAHEALVWVMGMRRYGHVREVAGPAADGYFRYEAIAREAAE